MNKNNKLKLRLFAIFSFIIICIGCTIKPLQNDSFYIIKLGDFIVHHGLDFKDHWCWITNLSYTYPHWLYDVFIYLIYNRFGFHGIYISVIITYIILITSIYIVNLKLTKNELLSLIISLICIPAMSAGIVARSQSISYIIFILEIYFIEELIRSGKKKYIIYLALLSLILANVHATVWLFFFILFLPFLAEQFIYKIKNRFKIKTPIKLIIKKVDHFKLIITSLIISFIMGLFSPSKICYSYVFKVMMGNSQKLIQEHLPLIVIKNPMFLGLIILLIFIFTFTDAKIKLRELLMLGGLTIMSLMSVRHTILFFLICSIYIPLISMRYLNEKKDCTLDILCNLFIKKKWVYALGFVLVLVGGYISFNHNYKYDFVDEKEYPIEAVKYIKNNIDLDQFRVFNNYNYGSYLMFNDIPTFIDSRCDLYLKEFNNKIDIFNDAVNYGYDYEKIFKKYNINYVLTDNNSYLNYALKKDTNYVTEYNDNFFTIFRLNIKEQ